jgi:hypothetical protein
LIEVVSQLPVWGKVIVGVGFVAIIAIIIALAVYFTSPPK